VVSVWVCICRLVVVCVVFVGSFVFFYVLPRPPRSTRFPYTTLFRSARASETSAAEELERTLAELAAAEAAFLAAATGAERARQRSEEHTSELQSRVELVCRLLLEKKKKRTLSSIRHSN